MKTLVAFLNKPYPYYFLQTSLFATALILFALVFLFLYLLEPFNVDFSEHKYNYFVISGSHAGVVSIIFYAFFSIINFKNKYQDIELTWKIKHEVVHLSLLLILVGFGNFIIRDIIYINTNNFSLNRLFEEVKNTFFAGGFVIIILTIINFFRLNSENKSASDQLNIVVSKQSSTPREIEPIFINTQSKFENFWLDPENFIYAQADGNYLEIWLMCEGKTVKLLKRITLKQLEDQLQSFNFIVKTHRTYLVNKQFIEKIAGSAQGYTLTLKHVDQKVPVSRGQLKVFKQVVTSESKLTDQGTYA